MALDASFGLSRPSLNETNHRASGNLGRALQDLDLTQDIPTRYIRPYEALPSMFSRLLGRETNFHVAAERPGNA